MKKTQVLFSLLFMIGLSFSMVAMPTTGKHILNKEVDTELLQKANIQSVDQFLDLTPKTYKELTRERLTIKETIQMKAAQKAVGELVQPVTTDDIPKALYIVAIIFGFGWLVMGLLDGFQGNNWWINLILTVLCWVPGVIHGLIKMDEYY